MSTDTDLRSRLRDLADDAPQSAFTAEQLWRSGVRRQRRRVAAGAVGVAAALGLVAGLGTLLGPPAPDPAPADVPFEKLAIPRAVHAPHPWSAGTDELGPPGPLAVVGASRRLETSGLRGTRGRDQLFGISAADGSARFLDLPTYRDGYDVPAPAHTALSPDGRKVAVPRFRTRPTATSHALTGWDVYDTVSGDTTELRVPELESIVGIDAFEIRFSGDSRYLMTNFSLTGSERSRQDSLVAWDVSTAEYHVAEGTGHHWLPTPGSGPRGVVWSRGRRMLTFDPETEQTAEQTLPHEVVEGSYAADGETLAYLGLRPTPPDQQPDRWRLFVAEPGSGAPREVDPGVEPDQILGWRDQTHVVVQLAGPRQIRVVDLAQGDAEPLRLRNGGSSALTPMYAADLFANPLVEGQVQPDAQDPRVWLRWWIWVGGAGLVLGLAGLALRRRRVRA